MSDPTTRNPQFQTPSELSGFHLEREFAPSLQRFVQDLGPHETPDPVDEIGGDQRSCLDQI